MADKSREPAAKEPDAEKKARKKRVKTEKNAFDTSYKPGADDAQIDASGARFDVDA